MIGQLLNKYLKGFEAKRILDVDPGYNNFGCMSAQITGATHITYVDNDSDVLNWISCVPESFDIVQRFTIIAR